MVDENKNVFVDSSILDKEEWLLCPVCKNKTRTRIRQDTTLTNFPLFCPKCKQETLVNVRQLNTVIIKSQTLRRRADEL